MAIDEKDVLDKILEEATPADEEVVVKEVVVEKKDEELPEEDLPVKLTKLEQELDKERTEKKGILKDLLKERGARRANEDKLGEISNTLAGLLKQREEKKAEKVVPITIDKIALELDEAGNAFIKPELISQIVDSKLPKNDIAELNKKYDGLLKAVEEEKSRRREEDARAESQTAFTEIINGILGEAENYQPAYGALKKAHDWVNEAVKKYQIDNEIGEIKSSGQAVDLIEESGIAKKFADVFPDVDVASVIRMYDSKTDLRRALKSLSVEKTSIKKIDDKVLKAAKKPSGLGGIKNQKSSASTLDEIASLTTDDILGLSDAETDKIKKILRLADE